MPRARAAGADYRIGANGVYASPFLGMVPGYPQLSVLPSRPVAEKPAASPLPPAIEPTPGATNAAPANLPAPDRGLPRMSGKKVADAPAPELDIRPWVVASYLAGVAMAIGWWLLGLAGLVRVLRTANPAPPRCHELLTKISAGRGNRVRI